MDSHAPRVNEWKGPLFDPEKLKTDAGRRELTALATKWYQVTHDAIRRYDKHHLILGDRYEANAPIAEEVVRAALPYVDVLSFQHFKQPDEVAANLHKWHDLTGKPVLLADHAAATRSPVEAQRHEPAATRKCSRPCAGFPAASATTSAARISATTPASALRNAAENPDTEALASITTANREAAEWMKAHE